MKTLKRTILFASIAIILFLSISNCGRKSPDAPPDVTPPMLIAQNPAYMAQQVPTNISAISATFNKDIDPATVVYKSTVSLTYFDGPNFNVVEGSVACAGTTITFTPGGPLAANSTYRFTLTPNIKDTAGNSYQGPLFEIVFTTGAQSVMYTVTPSAGPNGAISPNTVQNANPGETKTFTVTPNAGYVISSVTGSCGGTLSGNTYTTNPVNANCTVIAGFGTAGSTAHTVTASAGPNGSIAPSGAVKINDGSVGTFTVTPNAGYRVASATGCGGSLSGNTYTTGPITADCTVSVSFTTSTVVTHTVTATAGPNGSISPSGAITVNHGSTRTFTVSPFSGYQISSVGGTCGGTLSGNTYTTNAINADCTVAASFSAVAPATHTVTASSGGHGSIQPSGAITVNDGASAIFTIRADRGYRLVTPVGGTCGGSLSGSTYTTNPVRADCTVYVTFTRLQATVTPLVSPAGTGTIVPGTPQLVYYEDTISFTVTPEIAYQIASVSGCGGQLAGNIYTTGLITGDCTVTASFAGGSLTVTPSAGANGQIAPAEPQQVNYNGVVVFTITPGTGYSIASASGCSGTLTGNVYTTGQITSNCTVTVTFSPTIAI